MMVSIWPEEGATVDEMSLEFSPLRRHDALALVTPGGYPSPLAQYESTPDGNGVIYGIPDLGFQGTGTLKFEFLLRKDSLVSISSPVDQLCRHMSFTMHKGGILKLTEQHAEGAVCLEIP